MSAQLGLLAASSLATFLLRTSAEWLMVMLLVRIARSASLRCALWLGMLVAIAAQWLWTLSTLARSAAALHSASTPLASAAALPNEGGIAVHTAAAIWIGHAIAAALVLYAAGLARQILAGLIARIRLARALKHRRAPAAWLAAQFDSTQRSHRSHCELWVLPGIASPATLGWLRPRIFVPSSCEAQDPAELETIFWHELKHIERRDALWGGLARWCGALIWFHPAARFALHNVVAERELACDDAVVRQHPESRGTYAACLVRYARVAELSLAPALPAVEMASRTTQLSTRVRFILSEKSQASLISRVTRGITGAIVAAMAASALPGLGLAFHGTAVTALPISALASQRQEFQPYPKRTRRLSGPRIASVVSSPAQTMSAQAVLTPHDDALAAEHRVAMGILTESTGMDTPSDAATFRGDLTLSREPSAARGGASQAGSIASVAVDAAERMGPLLGRGDADDHR
ncbi:MAG TPA: M56 family metallopeptidase [Acidobacteriaceae bacterium]|nr:M56 family metallopeptidase [Acidobacteriaceae bacterium]